MQGGGNTLQFAMVELDVTTVTVTVSSSESDNGPRKPQSKGSPPSILAKAPPSFLDSTEG